MQIKDENELAFFERISKCMILDIHNRTIGIKNDELYVEALAECIYSAYVECIKEHLDIECQDFVRAVYHLEELRRIARILLADCNFKVQDKTAQIRKSLYSFSVSYLSVSYLETNNPSYEVYANLVSVTKMFLDDDYIEDDMSKKIPRLYQCLIELDATKADASLLCSLIYDFERKVQRKWRDFLMNSYNRDSRVIARLFHLGTYASLDGYESNFAYYVESFLAFSYIMNH